MAGNPSGSGQVGTKQPVHHLVGYDSTSHVPDSVAAFLSPGARPGCSIFVVALPGHAADLAKRLPPGNIRFLDATKTCESLLTNGKPDPAKFDKVIAAPIREAAKTGPVYAFGEMVAVLCMNGRHQAALELEQLWNGLLAEIGASLLCGYPKTVLASEADAKIVRELKRAHDGKGVVSVTA